MRQSHSLRVITRREQLRRARRPQPAAAEPDPLLRSSGLPAPGAHRRPALHRLPRRSRPAARGKPIANLLSAGATRRRCAMPTAGHGIRPGRSSQWRSGAARSAAIAAASAGQRTSSRSWPIRPSRWMVEWVCRADRQAEIERRRADEGTPGGHDRTVRMGARAGGDLCGDRPSSAGGAGTA